jgi:16S rRNA (guanine527-N7)-methyltransferase
MSANPPDKLSDLVGALASEFPQLDSGLLTRYLVDIVQWNERIGLVSRQSTIPSLGRLVRQSVYLYYFIRKSGLQRGDSGRVDVVDVGSGAGFPGLVWKLVAPELGVTLVERKRKKVTFLERACVVLRMQDVEVVEGDAAEISSWERYRGRFAVAVSLAVGPPKAVARCVEPFLRDGGYYCTVRPGTETAPARAAGRTLVLQAAKETEHGQFQMFRKTTA